MNAAMYLVQIFLPLYDNAGQPIDQSLLHSVRKELVDHFGGFTGHTRAPLEGLWKEDPQHTTRDEMVIFEVMSETLERPWWAAYRSDLERRFRQEQVLIRAHQIEIL